MNISIIGAGPVGCYCGYLLAKNGHQVDIYEEHKQIGLPIQCTGLLTHDFDKFKLPKDEFLINTFSEIEVNSPNYHQAVIAQKEYLIDRHKFDNYLAKIAKQAGANFHLQHAFLRREGNFMVIKNLAKNKEIYAHTDKIIAADGPLSRTARSFGLYNHRRANYYGIQAVVKGNFNPQRYQTFFGNKTCPQLFAWIVPESATTARVGLATIKNAKKYFDAFLAKHNFKVKELQAGTIPLYNPKQKLCHRNCYLLGDASGFVKATTLGGIIPGMRQAQILARCICEHQDYEKATKPLKKRLNLHLRVRNILNQFKDKDWDKLVLLLSQPKIQKIFEQHTRENPLPILIKALIKEPRLLWFGKKLFCFKQ